MTRSQRRGAPVATAVVAGLLALPGCARKPAPIDCADPNNQTRDECQAWAGQPQLPAQKFLYSWSFNCTDGGGGSRQVNVTYRSTQSCEDARTRYQQEPDPCAEFGDERWPGWRTASKEPAYPGETCDQE